MPAHDLPPMRIISLQAENVKRLRAVTIKPDGALVEITGKNGAGKTSVLDALWWAIKGDKVVQERPIRTGQERATIKVDLGALVITRRFQDDGEGGYTTTLKVEDADGRCESPQKLLDSLFGALSFDPLDFTRMKVKDQFDTLRAFVPDVDFEGVARANKRDFEDRTEINREARSLWAQAEALIVPEGAPAEPIDKSALLTQIEEAAQHNASIERHRSDHQLAQSSLEVIERDLAQKLDQKERLEAAIADLRTGAAAAIAKIAELPAVPEPKDIADLRRQLDEAETKNQGHAALERRSALVEQAKGAEAKAEALTQAMQAREDGKKAAIAKAKMPIDGLGFADESVTLNGMPFSQGSDAEQLRASIAIAAALNPKLRVIRVRDGSLLDADSMVMVGALAEEMGLQVWVETVESGRPGAILIEDGQVATRKVEAAA